jgi:hypothetical protein
MVRFLVRATHTMSDRLSKAEPPREFEVTGTARGFGHICFEQRLMR